ncbi:MAG: glycosyltransferase [Cloacibacillus sp.]
MSRPDSLAVIYASEGTGHKTAALALCEAYVAANPDGRVICCDILDFIAPWMKYIVSEGYVAMARRAPWMWGAFYWGSDRHGMQAGAFEWVHGLLCRMYLPRLKRLIEANEARAVVFTHYFGAAPLASSLAGRVPVFYADTDFESHRFQRRREFAWNFTASERAAEQRRADGIFDVSVTGVPIAGKFARLPSREEARARLGVDGAQRVILVSGGGIGAGSVEAAAKSLAAKTEWLTVVICGNNKKLYTRMKSFYRYKENMRIEGFVGNMEDYYAASDAAVMKPGGLSTSEALAAGLPMLLIDPVPGQEELNLAYLTTNGAAEYLVRPGRAAEAASRIFADGTDEKMREAAFTLAKPNAAAEIIREVCAKLG